MMVSMAKKASVPVITHWDHGRSMEIIHNAWVHGMNSLMRDASALISKKNIRLTKEAVDFFHPLGIPVEAELGHVGNETVYEEALAGYHYTDPSQRWRLSLSSVPAATRWRRRLVTSTASIPPEPKLNFEVVKRVRRRYPFRWCCTARPALATRISKSHFIRHFENQYPHRTVSGRQWRRCRRTRTSRSCTLNAKSAKR